MRQTSKISFLFAAFSLSVAGFTASAQEVITIQQAIDKTLNNNLQVKQAQFSAALADENYGQSKNALLPSISGSINGNRNFGRSIDPSTNQFISQQFNAASGSINGSVDLFAGGQKVNQIKQNKLLLDADKANVEKVKNDLILQVVTSYMQILFNKDLLKAAQQQLEVAKQTLNQQQQLLDVGNKTLADVSQAKSQVATSELEVTNAQNNLAISYLTLNQLMELPSDNKFEVQVPLVDAITYAKNSYSAPEVVATAMTVFPDIRLASLRAQAAEKAIDVARGTYYPRLSFGGGVGSNYSSIKPKVTEVNNGLKEVVIGKVQGTQQPVVNEVPDILRTLSNYSFGSQIQDNFNQFVGFSLSIPIFNGYQARSNVRRAKINYQNAQVDEQLSKNNLNKVIYQAVADLRAAESRFRSTTNAFAAQKDAFFVIEQRYNVGLANSVEFSTAQTNRNKAEIDMIQAKYDLLFKSKVIDYYLGKQIAF
ncbi:TolC family protein [Pedobacter xixiisoli]|uniref:Outer membrane protein n=1 Tax=Pedobacter xixiisoli TaxID=1476464 RepID=A0A286A0P8_9SPHI|nr:TolC family protein [Pedobacter xixiisoli]SOD15474.1 outer membrane protein [Pedobacter xixiisoli]